MTLEIRRATHDDIPEIERVMRASVSGLGVPFYDDQERTSAARFITVLDRQLVDDGTFYVVTDGDRVVACGGWSRRKRLFTGSAEQAAIEGELDPATDAARIRAMFVLPEYARRGIGRLILDTSESHARETGFTHFELMATLPGVPLYEACGYRALENATIDLPDGIRLQGIRMAK